MKLANLLNRSLIPKLLLALMSLIVTIVVAEIAFRFLFGEKVKLHGMWSPHEVMGTMLTPGFEGSMTSSEFRYDVAINEHGMRDGSITDKPPETRRVLVIGDSFVFGEGVQLADSLPKVLERYLNDLGGGATYETFNAGMPGSSPFHHLHNLRRLAPLIRPDLVVHVFFVGDDWYGNSPRRPPREIEQTPRGWLRSKSSFYRYLDRFLLSRSRSLDMYTMHYAEPTSAFLERRDQALEYAEEIRSAAQEHGAELFVALIPRFVQVYEDAWSKASMIYGLEDDLYDVYEPNRRFDADLKERGFNTLDVLPPLVEEGSKRMLHYPIDGHWNVEGNDFVSRLLAETILSGNVSQEGMHGENEEI